MRAIDLAVELLRVSHTNLRARFAKCPDELLFAQVPGGRIAPVAAIAAHAVFNEDAYLSRELVGTPPLFEAPEWREFLPAPSLRITAEWAAALAFDRAAFEGYMEAVFTASEDALPAMCARLELPGDWTQVEFADGEAKYTRRAVPRMLAFSDMVTLHTIEHAAEISALLGARGLQGSPWE